MSTKISFSAQDIYKILPHKYPFVMVDEGYDIIPGKRGYGIKEFTINEWFFQGHFPGNPIVPGVLIIEALAQNTALVYLSKIFEGEENTASFSKEGVDLSSLAKKVGYLVKTDIKFLAPVQPPARMVLYSEVIRAMANLSQVRVRAKVNNKVVAEGTLNVSEKEVKE